MRNIVGGPAGYDEVLGDLLSLMDAGFTKPILRDGKVMWVPVATAEDIFTGRILTKEEVIAHYEKGGE